MDNFDIVIEKPAFGGSFIGFHNGKAVFVEGVLPGEKVAVVPSLEKKDYIVADLLEINEASPLRSNSPCPIYLECGGCSYLHTDYETELHLKKTIAKDTLRRIAGIISENISLLSADRFHYRSHATVKLQNSICGYYKKNSNDLVPLPSEGCRLLAEPLNKIIAEGFSGEDEIRLALDTDGKIHTSLSPEKTIIESDGGISFKRKIWDFYQANLFLREKMLEVAEEYAGLDKSRSLLDIGCGVGFFTLFLAGNAKKATGIDINRNTIESAKKNALFNNIENVSFIKIPAAQLHPQRHAADVIIADPPRAGLDKKTRKTILAMEPERIVYISCNPSTFARDVKSFAESGYSMKKITLLDMFPGTHHMELAALLLR